MPSYKKKPQSNKIETTTSSTFDDTILPSTVKESKITTESANIVSNTIKWETFHFKTNLNQSKTFNYSRIYNSVREHESGFILIFIPFLPRTLLEYENLIHSCKNFQQYDCWLIDIPSELNLTNIEILQVLYEYIDCFQYIYPTFSRYQIIFISNDSVGHYLSQHIVIQKSKWCIFDYPLQSNEVQKHFSFESILKWWYSPYHQSHEPLLLPYPVSGDEISFNDRWESFLQ